MKHCTLISWSLCCGWLISHAFEGNRRGICRKGEGEGGKKRSFQRRDHKRSNVKNMSGEETQKREGDLGTSPAGLNKNLYYISPSFERLSPLCHVLTFSRGNFTQQRKTCTDWFPNMAVMVFRAIVTIVPIYSFLCCRLLCSPLR